MAILAADWAGFSRVLPIAERFGVGIEFQEFTQPEYLDHPEQLIQIVSGSANRLPSLSMHGPFAELIPASQDPWVRQVAARRFQQAYDILCKTNAQHLILHSGFFPKTYSGEKWIQNAYNFWVDFLHDKPDRGVIHMENVYEDDFGTLQALIDKVNQALGADMLTICLDIGHVNANSSHTFEEWIPGLGDRIRYVHLHNNGGILDDHWRFDRGTIDIPKVLELLLTHAPRASWSVETAVEDVEPSLQWLQNRGFL